VSLRARARVAVKAPLIAGTMAGLYATWRALRPPARLVGREERLRGLVFSAWAKATHRILGLRVRAEGSPPRGPCLLVANHLGYLDIAVLQAQRDCTFVSMADVKDWPVMGRLARELGTVFVEREKRADAARAAREIEAALRAGRTVVLFPEGRAGDGKAVRPFRSALLDPAARLGTPVAWAALQYRTPDGHPPADEVVCWTDDSSFGSHLLRLMRLPRVDVRLAYGDAPIVDQDRKRLAKKLEDSIRARMVV
jgi:1-acyl-sn-glycerol-3-phosphate acyltransferase